MRHRRPRSTWRERFSVFVMTTPLWRILALTVAVAAVVGLALGAVIAVVMARY